MAVFVHHATTICEILRMDEKWIAENVDFTETRQIREMIARRDKIVVVGGHLGNWEIFGACWKYLGHPSVMLSRPLDNPYIEKNFSDSDQNMPLTLSAERESPYARGSANFARVGRWVSR